MHDTGWITVGGGDSSSERLRVAEVSEAEDGRIVHYLEAPTKAPLAGAAVHGSIDGERRRDHMQQHSGQHVLSAAFIELYSMPTVSFHMGEDYCSIDLATPVVSAQQMVGAERTKLCLRIVRCGFVMSRARKRRSWGCASCLRRDATSCG